MFKYDKYTEINCTAGELGKVKTRQNNIRDISSSFAIIHAIRHRISLLAQAIHVEFPRHIMKHALNKFAHNVMPLLHV